MCRQDIWGKEGNNYMAGIMEGQTGNQNVTWETAKKLNVGFDLGLFNDVVSLQVDIFKEKRDGILITRKTVPVLAGFSGASIPVGNLGKAENKGIETALEVKKELLTDYSTHYVGISRLPVIRLLKMMNRSRSMNIKMLADAVLTRHSDLWH